VCSSDLALEEDKKWHLKVLNRFQVKTEGAGSKFTKSQLPGSGSPAAASLEVALDKLSKKYKGAV
jgi:hypothetical protein